MSRFDKSRLPSRHVTEGAEKAPTRAMLLGTGLAPEDLDRPLIGVATTWVWWTRRRQSQRCSGRCRSRYALIDGRPVRRSIVAESRYVGGADVQASSSSNASCTGL